jgi:uncharacterized C2H2 Zn-finger protein
MNLDLASKPVKCPNCGGVFYETTEEYDPGKMTTGAMLRFTEKYGPNGYNWSLPFSDNDMSEGLICVECGADMAPSGYLGIDKLVLTAPDEPDAHRTDDQDQRQTTIPPAGESEGDPFREHGIPEEVQTSDDSLTRYMTQKSCPECGGFFTTDEWDRHLASHPKEVRDLILGIPGPVEEKPILTERASKGWPKGKKRKPDVQETIKTQCPLCEKSFEKNMDFDSHLLTHNLEGVQQSEG